MAERITEPQPDTQQPPIQTTQHQTTQQTTQQQSYIQHTETVEFKFQKYHNICAFIDPEIGEMKRYADLMRFLMRSRISKAIQENVSVFKTHQIQFWKSVGVDDVKNPKEIVGSVHGHKVVITESLIREILQFGDSAGDPVELNKTKVRGCLIRCGYPAQRGVVEGTVYKKFFCPVYKYLAHVLIHCLGPRKSGFDQMSQILQDALAALILNMPFNFSKMIFDYLAELVTGKKDPFLMYPRFLQIMFNSQIPDLVGEEGDILVFAHMDLKTVRSMRDYSSKHEKPKDVKLFGHVINLDYVCPPGDKWRNEGSDAEKEEIVVTQVTDASGSKRKGTEEEEEVEEVEVPLKRRKKLNLALAPRATASSAKQPSPIPDPTTTTTTTTTTTSDNPTPPIQAAGSSSTKIDEQMYNMQQLVISMMNRMNKQDEEMEKLKKEKEEMVALVEEVRKEKEETVELVNQMRKENAESSNLLMLELGKSRKLEERVAEVEKRYDDLQNMLVKDSEGYFRDKDYVGSDSEREDTPRLTSTSAGTRDAAK